MNIARATLAILTCCGLGVAAGSAILHLGPKLAGLGIAITAAAVLLLELCNAIRRDRERMRRGREAVWQRRIEETPGAIRGGKDPAWLVGMKPWPVGDDERRS